eukprot:9178541-Pyramimonas_sp.AAC.1
MGRLQGVVAASPRAMAAGNPDMLLQSLSTHLVELQRAFVLHRRAVVPGGPGAEPRAEPHDVAPALGAPMEGVVP